MPWTVVGFDESAWKDMKRTIAEGRFCTSHSDFFGQIRCGALCFDIVLRDMGGRKFELCADAYLLGRETGYAYTSTGIPYDFCDGFEMKFDVTKTFSETVENFIAQCEEAMSHSRLWAEYAEKTDLTWDMFGENK